MPRWIRLLIRKLTGKTINPASVEAMICEMKRLSPTTDPEKKGLESVILPGTKFPWRGLWFNVEAVGKDSVLLRAEGTTWQRAKAMRDNGSVVRL